MTRWIPLFLAAMAFPAQAQFSPNIAPEITVRPTSAEIRIDGVIDPAEWIDAAEAGNFSEHSPGDQIQPPVDTRVLVTYDPQNLYVAFICYDDPAAIRASFCQRDRIFSDDYVILCLDTYGDSATAFEIACNPLGIQGDLYFSATGGEDISYDLIFDTAGQINDEGWVAEFAIPFSSLRFPDQQEQVWKVDFWRNSPRHVRYQMSWPYYDRDESCWPCKWGTMYGLENLEPTSGLEVLPAVVSSQAGRRTDDTPFENGKVVTRGSLSAKYGITSNIIAEATVRPDFSQVESDAAQIDVNSNFALFYPEKRPFFMEGSDLFNTYFNAVYTRSINDPTVAGKLTGRSGQYSFALLSALDRSTAIILPFEEHSRFVENGESVSNIFRVKKELGDQTYVGLVGTDRRYSDGGSGSLIGLDSKVRLNRAYSLEMQYLHSFTTEPDDSTLTVDFQNETFDEGRYTRGFNGEEFNGHALYTSFERNGRSWSFDFDYWDRSPTFRAENGFETRNNQRRGSVYSQYIFRFEDSTWMDYLIPSLYLARNWNYQGQRKEDSAQFTLEWRLRKSQISSHSYYGLYSEVFQGVEYDDLWRLHVCARTTPTQRLTFGGHFNYANTVFYQGEEIGRQTDYGFWADVKPWDRLLWSASFSHSHSNALDRDATFFDGFVTRHRVNLQITRELSARLVLQYNDFRELWEADPLLTYQLDPFSIFYIGSTRDYRLYNTVNDPDSSWQLAHRQYFVKFQYLFKV